MGHRYGGKTQALRGMVFGLAIARKKAHKRTHRPLIFRLSELPKRPASLRALTHRRSCPGAWKISHDFKYCLCLSCWYQVLVASVGLLPLATLIPLLWAEHHARVGSRNFLARPLMSVSRR